MQLSAHFLEELVLEATIHARYVTFCSSCAVETVGSRRGTDHLHCWLQNSLFRKLTEESLIGVEISTCHANEISFLGSSPKHCIEQIALPCLSQQSPLYLSLILLTKGNIKISFPLGTGGSPSGSSSSSNSLFT